jgi:hypothetical protein
MSRDLQRCPYCDMIVCRCKTSDDFFDLTKPKKKKSKKKKKKLKKKKKK